MRMMKTIWIKAALLLATPAAAEPCRGVVFEDTPFTVCQVQPGADLRLWLNDAKGRLIGTPERLAAQLAPGEALAFAMNAGMYHADRRPVGLYIANGAEVAPIVTAEGPGNFGMLPNGVFCAGDAFAVIESRRYAEVPPACRIATQSGPMLVIEGALHPRFLPDSDSLNIRNGVGVSADGQTAWFAISDAPVTFHRFARLFRDELGAPNALYLDGSVSRLIAPGLGRVDLGAPMGPIIGLVTRD